MKQQAHASVSSRKRRTVLQNASQHRLKLVAQARKMRHAHLRTVAAAVVETVHAPPAMTFLQALHFQIPTAVRLTESLPQNVQV